MFDFVSFFPRAVVQGIPLLFGATGETLTDFILKEKTEEAKRLLRYSDKSFTAIGSYLGFSSLGHFSQVFKKYTGRTPTEYRDKYAK